MADVEQNTSGSGLPLLHDADKIIGSKTTSAEINDTSPVYTLDEAIERAGQSFPRVKNKEYCNDLENNDNPW